MLVLSDSGPDLARHPLLAVSGAFRSFFLGASASRLIAWLALAATLVLTPALHAGAITGQFIAVGETGTILTSPDATTWTTRTSGTGARLRAVVVKAGQLIAVGEGGVVLASTDSGATWSARTSAVTETLRGVAASGTRFVAVGGQNNSVISYSDDGVTWSVATVPTLGKLRGVTWGNNLFVAVGAGGTVLTSPDGAAWTTRNASTTERLDGAFWTGSQFSVLSATGKVLTSTDGISWNSTQGAPPWWIEGLTWGDSTFVAVGAGGKVTTSANSTTWTLRSSGTTKTLHGVTWSGAFSSQTADPIAGLAGLRALSVSSVIVAVGESGTILTSPDGTTWTSRTSGTAVRLRAVTAQAGLLVAVGETGTVLMSVDDGASWLPRTSGITETLRGVATSATRFVAVGGQTNSLVVYSDDGVTWSSATVPAVGKLRGVTWGNNRFLAVGANGAVLTSPDGATWTTQNASTTERLDGAFWTGSQFSVLSATGKIFTSTDGVSWTSAQGSPPSWIEGLAWSDAKFIIVGAGGKIKTSADAATWTFQTSGTTKVLHGATWTGPFVAQTIDPIAALADLRKITISGVTASGKVYDRSTTATLDTTNAALVGVASGDTVILSSTLATGTFADKNVGTGKTVTTTGFLISGANAGDYTLVAPSPTADITAVSVTISGATASDKTYDGGLAASVSTTSATVVGVISGDSVGVGGTATGTFATRTAGTGKTVQLSGLQLTGEDAGNYAITQPTATASITVKTLTVTGATASSKTYDATLTATPSFGSALLVGAVGGDSVTLVTSGGTASFATKTIGTGKTVTFANLGLTGSDSTNYTLTQPTTTADITAKALTVSGVTANNKTYDGNATATLNTASASLVGIADGDTVTLTGAPTGAFSSKTVGTGKTVQVSNYNITGADAANYTLTQPTTTATITAKTITVSGITASGKVYDGNVTATPSYTGATLNGVVSGDTVTFVSSGGSATFSSKTVATGKTVTLAGLTLGGADGANYTLTQPTTTADITAKNLTVTGITANNKVYDGSATASLNTGSAALVGVVSGDITTLTTSGATGTFANANAGPGKTVQVAGLLLAGADSPNYTVTQPTTTATITPAAVNISVGNLAQTYDGTPKSVSVTVTPGAAAVTAYSNTGSVPPTAAGTYSVSVSITDPNYSGAVFATLVIAKATQTVNFSAITGANFNVGSVLSLSATASSGLPVTYSIVSGTATLSGSNVTITQAGAVTIRATQAGNDNYASATAERSFTGVSAAKQNQTISFGALSNVTSDAGSITLSATASSGLPVAFTVLSGPATLSGNRLTLSGSIGLVTIRASQGGNDLFNPAPDVVRSFVVILPIPAIFFGDLTDDAGLAGAPGRGELITGADARVAAKQGDIAAAIMAGTNRGTLLIVAPSLSLNVSLSFTLSATGTYSVPFTSAGRSLTVTGSYNGSTLTGRIEALRVGFTTPVQTVAGSTLDIAGVYESGSINNATGGTATIVGANGQILVVASTGTSTAGAVGTVNANGSFNLTTGNATISGTVDAPSTTVSGTIAVANQPPVSFSSLSAVATHTDRLINLSSRVRLAPTRTALTGFVIGGTAAKRVLIRGVGPALAGFGVQGALTNPKLQLFDGASKLLLENDDWSGADTLAAFAQVGAFSLANGSKDAAILTTLQPGAYSVQVTAGAETGAALVEIYDASADAGAEIQRLVNISTRGTVDVGSDGLLIGGFVVTGNVPKKVLIRGVGPALGGFGVAGTLVDPTLAVYSGSTLVAQNNDWSTPTPVNAQQVAATAAELTTAAQSVGAFALTAASKDSAVIITLAPGAYTAQVSGANATTGVALVEIYELP